MKEDAKSILKYFGVSSQGELLNYIKNNPDDKKVIELKRLFEESNVNVGGFHD